MNDRENLDKLFGKTPLAPADEFSRIYDQYQLIGQELLSQKNYQYIFNPYTNGLMIFALLFSMWMFTPRTFESSKDVSVIEKSVFLSNMDTLISEVTNFKE